jgi:ribosome-associated toxin RatA of RatAB toxin-antitoxin module
MPFLLPALVALLFSLTLPVSAAPDLSSEQHRRLSTGDVIVLDRLPPGGDARRAQGGTAIALVHAAPTMVWDVLVDFGRHRGLFPRVVESQVLERRAERTLVRYVVGIGPFSFGFHVNNWAEAQERHLRWQLARDQQNGLFVESWGYWDLQPHPDGTLLTYAMGARTVLPRFLTRGAERDGLVETVRAVRERVEGGG